jgi:hypothetical protein
MSISYRMRRTLSLVFLLLVAWSQARALDCPMEGVEEGAAAHSHAVQSPGHHDHGHGHHGAPGHTEAPAPQQHAQGCGALMACGPQAVASPDGALSAAATAGGDAPRILPARYLSPDLGFDPPPPRLAVL